MAVNNPRLRQIHMTRENSYYERLDCSVTFFGVVHTSEEIRAALWDGLDRYNFDTVLYEEHITNGFDPSNVIEHEVIQRYNANNDVDVRSMDVPENSEHIDSLGEVMTDLASNMPSVQSGELTSENGMMEFNGRYEAEYPQLYSFAHAFRNDRMSIEIIREAQAEDASHIAVVVGKAHLFGTDSLTSKMDENLKSHNISSED